MTSLRRQVKSSSTEKVNFSPEKVQIIGISPDPVEKQKAFVEKEKLTASFIPAHLTLSPPSADTRNIQYPVLSDESKEVFQLYGIGKGMWGLVQVARVTFVIDQKGIVRCAFHSN